MLGFGCRCITPSEIEQRSLTAFLCFCAGQADEVFSSMAGDFMRPVVDVVDKLLAAGVNVTVYNGQLDLIVDTMGMGLLERFAELVTIQIYKIVLEGFNTPPYGHPRQEVELLEDRIANNRTITLRSKLCKCNFSQILLNSRCK